MQMQTILETQRKFYPDHLTKFLRIMTRRRRDSHKNINTGLEDMRVKILLEFHQPQNLNHVSSNSTEHNQLGNSTLTLIRISNTIANNGSPTFPLA
jgi:hypothetical protein